MDGSYTSQGGGGIITHNVPALHHIIEPYAHGWTGTLLSMAFDAVVGILLGIVVLGAVSLIKKLRGR